MTYLDADVECDLAASLPGDPVPSFGASDCDCEAHLLRAPDRETLLSATRAERERIA